MDMKEVIKHRRMTRKFSSQPIAKNLDKHIAEMALRSPTAGNCRAIDILLLNDERSLKQFWEVSTTVDVSLSPGLRLIQNAPVVMLPLYDIDKYLNRYSLDDKKNSRLYRLDPDSWDVPFWITDASFAAMTILLSAENYGLGALFFQLHRPQQEVLGSFMIPDHIKTIGAIALGYKAFTAEKDTTGNRNKLPDGKNEIFPGAGNASGHEDNLKNSHIHVNVW